MQMIVRIDERESSGTTTVPCNVDGVLGSRAVVEYFKFVFVRMSVELGADNRVESVNNPSILLRPPFVATSATRWNVLQDVNAFAGLFSSKECVMKPLHGLLNLKAAVHDPPVEVVAIVVIQRDQPKSGLHKECVIAVVSDGWECGCWEPSVTLPDVS